MKKYIRRLLFLGFMLVLLGAGTTTIWASAPGKVKISAHQSNSNRKKYTVYWNKVPNASGYELRLFNQKNKRISTHRVNASARRYTFSGIAKGNIYRVRIRAYTRTEDELSGEDIVEYGKFTSTYISQQPKVTFEWLNSKSCRAKWSAVDGATSYTVYLSTRRGSGYRKVKTVKTNTTKIKKLKMNQNYYVYVVANFQIGDAKYKTPVSYSYSFCLEKE